MAYKDEYEVARLYTDGHFAKQLANTFDGTPKLTFHLAAPILVKKAADGTPVKREFGGWILPVFRLLAKFKGLRGTRFDYFGKTPERAMERGLLADYEAMLNRLAAELTPQNHAIAVALASIPEKIRGYGHVKIKSVTAAKAEEAQLWAQWQTGESPRIAAE